MKSGEHRAGILIKQDLFDIGCLMLSISALCSRHDSIWVGKLLSEAGQAGRRGRAEKPESPRERRVLRSTGSPNPAAVRCRRVPFRGAWRNASQFTMIKGTGEEAPRICMRLHLP